MQGDREKLTALEREDGVPSDEVTATDRAGEDGQPRSGSSLRGVQHLKGVQDIGTGLSRRMRAIPNREEHYYLDLYLLQKERERLTQEGVSVGKRRLRVSRRLAGIREEMAEKEQKAVENMNSLARPARATGARPKAPPQNRPKKYEYKEEEWQRMSLHY